jgi:hypothetical protein
VFFFSKALLTTLSFFMDDDGHPYWYHGKNPKNQFKTFLKI